MKNKSILWTKEDYRLMEKYGVRTDDLIVDAFRKLLKELKGLEEKCSSKKN